MAGKTIRGLTLEIGGDTQPLSKALGEVNQKSAALQRELKEVTKLLKMDPKGTEALSQKQKLLADAIENTRKKLDTLRSVQEQVNAQLAEGKISEGQYRAFQREIAKAEAELKKLEDQARKTNDKLGKLGDSFQAAGQKITSVGKDLTRKVTAPIVGLGALASKAAVDIETAFTGVRKTVDATEEEFAQLRQGFIDLAKDKKIPVAIEELMGIGEAAGQLGIEKHNIISFTETMAKLGATTNLASQEAATALARFANITQMPQEQFDRLGSTIVDLGNNLATTEREIVEMGLRLAGAGKQVGMAEAQILGFAGALSSVGIEAEAGGTAFSRVMLNINNEVDKGGEKLQLFAKVAGMTTAEFAKAWKDDAAGALVTFIEGLGKLQSAGQNVVPILEKLDMNDIRVRDSLLRAAGAGDLFRESLELSSKAWLDNTALTKEAEQRFKTTASQMEVLKNNVKLMAATFGEALLPAINKFIERISPLIERISTMDASTKSTILTIAGLAAAVGPMSLVFGPLISGIGGAIKAISAMQLAAAGGATGVGILTTAFPALGAAATVGAGGVTLLGNAIKSLAGPIGILIAAIGAATFAIFEFNKRNKEVVESNAQMTDSLTEKIEQYRREKAILDSTTASEIQKMNAQARLNAITNQYTGIAAEICRSYGLEGIEIDNLTGKINANTQAVYQNMLIKKAQAEAAVAAAQAAVESAQIGGVGFDPMLGFEPYVQQANNALLEAQNNAANAAAEVEVFERAIKKAEADFAAMSSKFKTSTGNILSGLTDAEKKAGKTADAAEKKAGKTADALESLGNQSAITTARMEADLARLEMAGDGPAQKIALLNTKTEWLNKLIAEQREVIARLTKAYEEQGEATAEEVKKKGDLLLKLEQEKKDLVLLEKQIYDNRKAIEAVNAATSKQIEGLRVLSDEVTEVEKKYREDLATALDDYQKKVEETNKKLAEDEAALTRQYENELNSRVRSLSNFVGLFDAVTQKEVSGETLLENLRGQVDAFENWQENIQKLAARGIDEGLLKELREMGPDAGAEIAALNTLTDEQLQEYVALWKEKNQAAREEAVAQLEQQRYEMQQKLMEIRAEATKQLEMYRQEWEKKNAEIRKNAEEELKKIQQKFNETAEAGTRYGTQLILNFATGMESQFDRLRQAVEEALSIVGALDPAVRHSPSMIDRVKTGVSQIYAAYEDLARKLNAIDFAAAINGVAQATASSRMALAGARETNYNYNTGGNTIYITVQDGEDLLRTLHRLGVRIP